MVLGFELRALRLLGNAVLLEPSNRFLKGRVSGGFYTQQNWGIRTSVKLSMTHILGRSSPQALPGLWCANGLGAHLELQGLAVAGPAGRRTEIREGRGRGAWRQMSPTSAFYNGGSICERLLRF
jgi:hypothetical protein